MYMYVYMRERTIDPGGKYRWICNSPCGAGISALCDETLLPF